MSEYIKKTDLFAKTINKNKIWLHITNAEGKNLKEIVEDLPTYSVSKGETYGEIINFYLNGLVETYKKMGYIITEISITEKNSLSPTVYEFGEMERG